MLDDLDLEKEIGGLKEEILYAYENNAPIEKTTGKTGGELKIRMIDNMHCQLLGYSYTGTLERGRRGGRVPKGFTQIIKRWAIAKNLSFSSANDLSRFAYFTAQKIAREGTGRFINGGREDILTEPIRNFADNLTKKISGLFIMELNNKIFEK